MNHEVEQSPKKDSADKEPINYICGVMDEETRPVLSSYLDQLQEGEGVLVIFRLSQSGDPDNLLEFNVEHFAHSKAWNCVSGRQADVPLQGVVDALTNQVNQSRLPNILFSQGGEKEKATDQHTVCFGVMGGQNSGKITTIKTIVHQQLNMGLNGDLLLHESHIIIDALCDQNIIPKHYPVNMRSYGAGGSASHDVHPGDILTSDAVIDIRTHIHPKCIIDYLIKYLQDNNVSAESMSKFNEKSTIILDRFQTDNSYTGSPIISDIEDILKISKKITSKDPSDIMCNFTNDDKVYYGEISVANSSNGATLIHRIIDEDHSGEEGQKEAKKTIVEFMNKMGEHEKNEYEINRLNEKLNSTNSKIAIAMEQIQPIETSQKILKDKQIKLGEEIRRIENSIDKSPREKFQFGVNKQIYADNERKLSKLNFRSVALNKYLRNRLRIQANIKNKLDREIKMSTSVSTTEKETQKIKSSCKSLHDEINSMKQTHQAINSDTGTKFNITASGNVFFNQAEKYSVSRFGANLVEMENQLFKQMIHRAIKKNIYIKSELISKIAADPVCIPDEVTEELNKWATQCTMTLDEYVEAYEWAQAGQNMQAIPPSGLWIPANELVNTLYPCGLIRIDEDPLMMEHDDLKRMLNNTPSYLIFQDNIFYADETLDVKKLDISEKSNLLNELLVAYNDSPSSIMNTSVFVLATDEQKQKITKATTHQHKATYKRLFYALLSKDVDASSLSNDLSLSSESDVTLTTLDFIPEESAPVDDDSDYRHSESDPTHTDSDFIPNEPVIVLNPFWKEVGVDLLEEISNGKAFSGSIFKRKTAEDNTIQSELKERAKILFSEGCTRDDIRGLFKDYLEYMVTKIPGKNREYPVYARKSTLYQSGYVSGEIPDWDAAIYKANNNAVLVSLVNQFLLEKPSSSVHDTALIKRQLSPGGVSVEDDASESLSSNERWRNRYVSIRNNLDKSMNNNTPNQGIQEAKYFIHQCPDREDPRNKGIITVIQRVITDMQKPSNEEQGPNKVLK